MNGRWMAMVGDGFYHREDRRSHHEAHRGNEEERFVHGRLPSGMVGLGLGTGSSRIIITSGGGA